MDAVSLAVAAGLAGSAKAYADAKIAEAIAALPKGVVWRGSVNYYADLPATPEAGDCYTVKYAGSSGTEPSGQEYAWGKYDGVNQWIPIGPDTSVYRTAAAQDVIDSGKADKVSSPTAGNFAGLDANGNLTDSGKKASDFLQEHQSLAAYRTSAAQDVIDATKQDKITASGILQGDGSGGVTEKSVDATPTASSENLVTSGGVAAGLKTKLSEPSSGLAVGKYFRVASIDAEGHAVLEAVDAKDVGLQGVQVDGTDLTPDANGKVNIPPADNSSLGLIRTHIYPGWGARVYGVAAGYDRLIGTLPASFVDINNRYSYEPTPSTNLATHRAPIVPNSINYSVKAALTDAKRINDMTDTEKQNAWGVFQIIKTTIDSVLVPLANYYLGEQSSLTLTLPTTATVGQSIVVCFSSGATACTMTCDLTGFSFVPKANKTNKITFTLIHKADAQVVGDEDKWTVSIEEG